MVIHNNSIIRFIKLHDDFMGEDKEISSQAKIWSVKSFLSKKNPPTQCILHNLVHCGVSAE